jgi:hypothetical protein
MGNVQLTRARVVGGQNAQDLSPAMVRDANHKFVYEKFDSKPRFYLGDGTATAPTGVAGDENVIVTDRHLFEYHVIGTQTILTPTFHVSKGLQLVQDAVSGDGSEISLGIHATSRGVFTVGTDPCFFKAKLEVTDVSGFGELAVGFRRQTANQALIDNYEDMAVFNIQSGVINIETILNGGGTITVDTTETDWVDAATHDLEVRVDKDGVASFYYDDAVPVAYPGDGTNAAFTFDDGDIIMAFIYQSLDATAANTLFLKEWQSGLGARSV